MTNTKFLIISLLLNLTFNIYAQPNEFTIMGDKLCAEDKRGLIFFGESAYYSHSLGKQVKFSEYVSTEYNLDSCVVYKLSLQDNFAKKLGVAEPSVYLFNKNMTLIDWKHQTSEGWDVVYNYINPKHRRYVKKTTDCLVTTITPTPNYQFNWDTHESLITANDKPKSKKIESPQLNATNASPKRTPGKSKWVFQIGAYGTRKRAEEKLDKCKKSYPNSFIIEKYVTIDNKLTKVYAVVIGEYDNEKSAMAMISELKGFAFELNK